MKRRLCFLRKEIGGLRGAGEVQCKEINDLQWKVLGEVQETLKVAAEVQRILEGDTYIISSLLPWSIFKIRMNYLSMQGNPGVSMPVQNLTKILLKDLDQRFTPLNGKVQFFLKPNKGHMNR